MATDKIYPRWKCIVDSEGMLKVVERDKFYEYLQRYAGNDEMQMVVRPFVKHRSRQEEKYYHAVVVQSVADAMDCDPAYAHDFLRGLFLTVEESTIRESDKKKIRYTRVRSTTELSDKEYHSYIFEKCVPWAGRPTEDYGLDQESGLGLYIPTPNEVDWSQYGY